MKNKILYLLALFTCFGTIAQNSSTVIDFENGPFGGGHHHTTGNFENDPVDNAYFNTNYHVQFFSGTYDFGTNTWNQHDTLPKYSTPGGVRSAFGNLSMSSTCTGGFNNEDLPYDAPDPGCWFLTDNDGLVAPQPLDLMIDYDQSAITSYTASASLYDLDGISKPEGWRVSLFTIDTISGITSLDNSIYMISVPAASSDWTNCVGAGVNNCDPLPFGSTIIDNDNGDASSTEWTLSSTSGNPIDYIILSYMGHGSNNLDSANARHVGVAFDNFYIFGAAPCDYTPEFIYNVDPTNPCLMAFSNITSYPPLTGFEVLQVSWDFGDGNSGIGDNISHYYDSPGVYTVCMTVWSLYEGECCQRTYCLEVVIEEVCDPCEMMSYIGFDPDFSGAPSKTFSVSGVPPVLQNVFAFHWDFGDGTTGTGHSVKHTYTSNGIFTVCLTIFYYDEMTGTCCSHEICHSVWVTEAGRAPLQVDHVDRERHDKDNIQEDLIKTEKIKIIPNPNQGEFLINSEDGTMIKSVIVYDQTGKKVYSERFGTGALQQQLNLSNLNKGIYVIVVNEDNQETLQMSRLILE